MNSSDLKPHHARRLADAIARRTRYLERIEQRMEELQFPPGDPLAVSVTRARIAMQDLERRAGEISRDRKS